MNKENITINNIKQREFDITNSSLADIIADEASLLLI